MIIWLPRTGQVVLHLWSNPRGAAEAEPPPGRRPHHPYPWGGTFARASGEPGLGLNTERRNKVVYFAITTAVRMNPAVSIPWENTCSGAEKPGFDSF